MENKDKNLGRIWIGQGEGYKINEEEG